MSLCPFLVALLKLTLANLPLYVKHTAYSVAFTVRRGLRTALSFNQGRRGFALLLVRRGELFPCLEARSPAMIHKGDLTRRDGFSSLQNADDIGRAHV